MTNCTRSEFCRASSSLGRGERGAIILLVEVLAVVFLVVAGLAIDSTLLATSKTQRRHTAEYISFEALRVFLATPGANNVRLDAARRRAEEIAGVNFFIGKPFLTNPSATEQIGTNSASNPAQANGKITPGIWWFEPPATCPVSVPGLSNTCPCDTSGNWAGPCFQDADLDLTPNTVAPTAFRVDLQISNASPLNTVLMRLSGAPPQQFTTQATATAVPRHGIFLVDLSRSSHAETHLPYEGSGGPVNTPLSRESAFKFVRQDNSAPTCSGGVAHPCSAAAPNCDIAGGPYPPAVGYYSMFDVVFDHPSMLRAPGALSRPAAPPFQQKRNHYRNEYMCYRVNLTDGASATQTYRYLVDTGYEGQALDGTSTIYYDGPEPFTSMLDGIYHTILMLEQQLVPGDMIGTIGFDSSAKIQERRFPLSTIGSSSFTDLKEITAVGVNTAPAQRAARDLKRIEQYSFLITERGNANYPEALKEAKALLLAQPNAKQVSNFVVMFSDGLSNCDSGRVCGTTEADYQFSINEAENILLNEYAPEGIKFHMMLIGDQVKPHSIVSPSQRNPGECMTDDEARTLNPPLNFVDSSTGYAATDFLNAVTLRSGSYFTDPNRLYGAVRQTDGIWAPVRNPCIDPSTGLPGDVSSILKTQCAAGTAGSKPGFPSQPNPVSAYPGMIDSAGRLYCDPLGRSRRKQVQDYVTDIIGGLPYVLVE